MRRAAALLLFVALFVAGAAQAQVRENVTVELIEVPVYVVAPGGQPIRGLTKEAFELYVNRRPQPIEYFDAIDFGAPAAEPEKPRPLRERRLYLLLFDQLYSIPGKLVRAQRAAAAAVAQSNPETDLFAVATYTANRGVQLATPFLSDRVAVRRAIDTLSVSRAADPLGLAISTGERAAWIAAVQDEGRGSTTGSRGDMADAEIADAIRGGAANQDMQSQPSKNAVEDLLGNFGDLAARLSALEGQKHVIYLSEGFQSSLVHGGLTPVPPPTGGGGLDARSLRFVREMFDRFRAAGVFLDAVDIAGVRHAQSAFQPYENDSLQFMAHGTGGEFVHNRNDLGNALTGLTNAQQVVYVLAFRRRGNREGSIDVKVHGVPRGTRLSFRQGFGGVSRNKSIDPLQLADILINDVPQTGLDLRMEATASGVAIELLPAEVIPQLPADQPFVDMILYVFDAEGSVVTSRQKRIDFDLVARKAKEPIVLRASLDLPPGNYVAKAIARVGGTTSLGYARREFSVPAR